MICEKCRNPVVEIDEKYHHAVTLDASPPTADMPYARFLDLNHDPVPVDRKA